MKSRTLFVGLALFTLTAPAVAEAPEAQVVTHAVSNLCLGVRGVDAHKPGADAEAYWCNPGGGDRGRDNQWLFERADEGFVVLKNRVSGLCLGVRGVDGHKAGTGVEVYHCQPGGADKGLDNQWRVVAEPDGFQRLENRVSGLCLAVRGAKPGAGAEVVACDAGRDARWRFQGL